MRALLLSVALALSAGCLSDDTSTPSRASHDDCVRLREHLIDVQLGGATADPALAAQHREAHRRLFGDSFLSHCSDDVTPDALACGLAAGDAASIQKCGLP